ncbi:MAG: PocR ligand-binding domain-containing protein [Lentisphaeria bacterium]
MTESKNITTQNPIQIMFRDEVYDLLDHFASLLKIRTVFYSEDGQLLHYGRKYHNCAYCEYVQHHIFDLSDCIALDLKHLKECKQKREIINYRCHAALQEMIAPVELYDHLIGYIMIGQFRTSDDIPDFIQTEKLKTLYHALPCLNQNDIDSLKRMLKILIAYIVNKELIQLPEDIKIWKIHQYCKKHLAENISLSRMAKQLDCSESSLSHYLQKKHQTSFTKILRKIRIDAAEKLLKSHPEMPISQLAFKIGYSDPHYFSRVYSQLRGFPPRKYEK